MIRSLRPFTTLSLFCVGLAMTPASAESQEARRRWERMCQIRAEKFDLVLPEAMADNRIDMWIVVMREGLLDPLWEALGRGYVGSWAYYVFSEDGRRVHRAAFGVGGYMLEQCGVYDEFAGADVLAEFVRGRDPMRIGVNMAESIGGADLRACENACRIPGGASVSPSRRTYATRFMSV